MNLFYLIVMVVLTINVANVTSMNFKCSEEYINFDYVDRSYGCSAANLKIVSDNVNITTFNDKSDQSSLTIFYNLKMNNQEVYFFPRNLAEFFPKLQGLQIASSKLKSIKRNDLQQLTNLVYLDLSGNNLKFLENELFKFNSRLKSINFKSNRLSVIEPDLLSSLESLQYAHFQSNPCINDYDSRPFQSVKNFIKSNCQIPEEFASKIEILNTLLTSETAKNEELRQSCEMRHKACDGNLDAAAENLLMISRNFEALKSSCASNDSFIRTPVVQQSVNLKGKSNGTQFNAFDFSVKFKNSTIKRVFEIIDSEDDAEAVALKDVKMLSIHEQQTLYLPTNIAENFKNLDTLSVTSSGLIQLDSNLLKGFENLTELILFNNKLIEIPSDTFDELFILFSIDLSKNMLKNLANGIFKNLVNLSTLKLNDNYIETLNHEVLQNLKNLKTISLENNKLKYISANLFNSLTKLTLANITNNICINASFPKTAMEGIKTMIIDSCIEPIALDCKSTIKVMKLELTVVQTVLICEAELTVNYPKTKIANLTSFHATVEGIDRNVIVFSAINQTMKFLPYQLGKTLPKLTMIFVERSQLTTLQKHDFEGMKKLKKIIVIHNNLTIIEEEAFDDAEHIEELNLSFNSIKSLPRKIFFHLVQLKTLILTNNQIKSFRADFLPRANSLVELSVNNNLLETIETKILRFLRKANKIDLSSNSCINRKFEKSEESIEALLMLSGEIDLFCSFDDLIEERTFKI